MHIIIWITLLFGLSLPVIASQNSLDNAFGPGLDNVTKRVSTFHEVNMDTYTALDGVLAQRCAEGFELSFGERGAANWKNMFEREI